MSHENDQLVRPRILAGWTTGLLLLIVSVSSQWWATGYSQEEQTSPIRLLRHPYLQKGTGHSMGIAWMIDDDQPCSVEYGLTRELGQVIQSGKSQRMHFVEITGLEPDTRYYYRIRSGKTWLTPSDESYHFNTHATDERRPFSFVVLGDSGQPEPGDQCPLADLLRSLHPKPDFIIHTGDVSQRWALDEAEYDLLAFGVYRDTLRNTPFYPTQGNHDWVTDWEHGLDPLYPRYIAPGRLDSRLTERFDMPFWRVFQSPRDNADETVAPFSFRYGNAMFVCEGGAGRGAGRSLAEKRFAEAGVTWRFFYSHYFGLAGNAVPGGDLGWKPPLPQCDLTFRGHIHVYSRSAPYGPHQSVDLLVGCSGSSIGSSYFESVVTPQNPHGLRPGITEWNEKCPHLIHVLVDGEKLSLKSYYPDGLVFDSLVIDKSGGKKKIVGMASDSHPVHPAWQRGLTPLMRRLWVDENPRWKSLGSGLWEYTGQKPLERLGRPIARRSRYIEPRFVVPRRRNHKTPANLQEAGKAIEQLMDIHYRLGRHEWDRATQGFFEERVRHVFGAGEASLPFLVQLVEDESLPVKQRLGALGSIGVLARRSRGARQQLVKFSDSSDFNLRFSACIIRACWFGESQALGELIAWMKRESGRKPPNPQFRVDTPGHYGNPIFVLRRFTFPALFSLDRKIDDSGKMLTIGEWIAFYEKNKHRLRYVPGEQRYKLVQ